MAAPSSDAMKARIINHMNADHQASLRLYARHYSKLPLSYAKTAKADDISVDHLILTSSFGRTLIPFKPALKSLAEARERLVAMNEESLKELDVDGTMIDIFPLPDKAVHWIWLGFCSWVIFTLPFRQQIHPDSGSTLSKIWSLGGTAPWLAKLAYTLGPATLWFIGIIHSVEAVVMATGRLRRHEVEMFSGVWWGWIVDVLLMGGGSFMRFDALVKSIKEKKERPKGLGKANGH
jgi:hypothetical protein